MGLFSSSKKKREIPQGMWIKCVSCAELLYTKEFEKNNKVCPKCDHHFTLRAKDRLNLLLDKDSFIEIDEHLTSLDPLNFQGPKNYLDKIKQDQKRSGLNDAVVCGFGSIESFPVAIGVMDFYFMAGSMGSVVGEKIARLIEKAAEKKVVLIIFCSSGGARMQESTLSLMQMSKTSGAIAYFKREGLLYISVLTDPTTGGTTASFASLGDFIFAEPKALIGFAGPRVIKQTINQDLPAGFQRSEFLLEHGLIDNIIHRKEIKQKLSNIISVYYQNNGYCFKPNEDPQEEISNNESSSG